MRMHLRLGLLGGIAFPFLLTLSFSQAVYSQPADKQAKLLDRQAKLQAALNDPGYTHFNCEGADAECLVSETPAPGVRMVRPKDYPIRPAHYLSSNLYTTLAADRETGNRFNAFDFQVPPEGGPLPHTHHNEWETFFVSDGVMKFTELDSNPPYNYILLDEPAGTVVYGSLGPVHGFQNKTTSKGRIFSFAMPAGLDQFFHNAGEEVVDYNAPIPAISMEEIVRTAFWAEQRGDSLWFLGAPPPVIPAGNPQPVISSANDARRPTETGPFGEKRVVLLSPTEVGNVTGATAFCGPGRPGRPGGSVKYTYLTMPNQQGDFPTAFTSQNTEVFYTLGGNLSFRFGGFLGNSVTAEPGTFIQIDPGVPFSIANLSSAAAQSLGISVISPVCP